MLKRLAKNGLHVLSHEVRRILGVGPVFQSGVHILMYHRVCPERDEMGIGIHPEFFEQQIRLLTENFSVVPLGEALEAVKSGSDRPLFVVTFDDGYRDNYTAAYPILRRYNAPATIFVTHDDLESGFTHWHRMDAAIRATSRNRLDLKPLGLGIFSLDTPRERAQAISRLHGSLKRVDDAHRLEVLRFIVEHCGPAGEERIMLTWSEVRQMAQSGLIGIGSHTLSHPILTRVSATRAEEEIRTSRCRIEEKIDLPVEDFAYPNGGKDDLNEGIVELVRRSGYRSACTTFPGCNAAGADPFALRRIDVTYGMCESVTGKFSHQMFIMGMAGAAAHETARTDPRDVSPAGA